MKVCIEKDQQGRFFVYQENEPTTEGQEASGMAAESPQAEASEQQDKQPARDLQGALLIAGKMLNADAGQDAAGSPFDQGLKSVLDQRQGM